MLLERQQGNVESCWRGKDTGDLVGTDGLVIRVRYFLETTKSGEVYSAGLPSVLGARCCSEMDEAGRIRWHRKHLQ